MTTNLQLKLRKTPPATERTLAAVVAFGTGATVGELAAATGRCNHAICTSLTELFLKKKVVRQYETDGQTIGFRYYPNTPAGRAAAFANRDRVRIKGAGKFPAGFEVEQNAAICRLLTDFPKLPVQEIARRVRRDPAETRDRLDALVRRGFVDFETESFRRTDGLLGVRRLYFTKH